MTARFVIIAEDELGQRLARDVVDRVIEERGVAWLSDLWREQETRASQRTFCGLSPDKPWSRWTELKRLAGELSVRVHGLGMKAERAMARKAVAIAAEIEARSQEGPRISALFLMHDTDGDAEKAGLLREGAQGRRDAPPAFPVVVAAPHPESEAWVLAGATPRSPDDRAQHSKERSRLDFDPVTQPERLSANRLTDKRDAKRVCEALLGPHGDRYEAWERCWKEAPLEVLEQNGVRAGLREYTEEIEQKILPLLGDARSLG